MAANVAYMKAYGMPAAELLIWPAALFEVIAGAMLVLGWNARWAALALAVYTVIAALIFHRYWSVPADQVLDQQTHFMKNVAIIGGLLFVFARRSCSPFNRTAVTLSPSLEFFSRAQERLTFDVPAGFADPTVIPRHDQQDADPAVVAAIAAVRPIRLAAVLVPIIERDEPSVLFTQRTAHLTDHAGQISFPGGKIDPGDESPAAAALREAEEEVALANRFVEPTRLSRHSHDAFRPSHPAPGGASETGLCTSV